MLHYDLHIHSCLSPCGEADMTPQNVCAMARLKGLDVIALTDHNSGGNLPAFDQVARQMGLLFIPGMELTTREELHLLAYFPSLQAALSCHSLLPDYLPKARNRPAFFGEQLLVDAGGLVTGQEQGLLMGALSLDLSEACSLVRGLGGVPVPAHIYRSFGLITVLGMMPTSVRFHSVEIKAGEAIPPGTLALFSSDAHRLGEIHERGNTLACDKNIQAVLSLLDGI